jgi:hypothetical protein
MQPESVSTHRKSPYVPAPAFARARAARLAGGWPFPDRTGRISPAIRRAALHVLRTTARDWGLAASR